MQRLLTVAGLLLTAAIVPALAQGEAAIRGQVRAAVDGSWLAAVAVTLTSVPPGEAIQAMSDGDGWFSFQNVRPGEYLLSGEQEGFARREQRLILEPREIKVVVLLLDLRRVEVDVQVMGEASPLASTHSPSSTVLSADRLESQPASQRSTLTDALVTLAPGMIRGHDDFVHVRGHEMALNPVVNGVSFWENPHAALSAGLSPEVIETANVMTGGFPAEYGNRFGGVVDIVTKSGMTMRHGGALTVNGGSAGRRNVSGDLGGHRERFGYYLFGSVFESARFLSPPDPHAIHDSAGGGHAFIQLDENAGRAGSLRVILMSDGANVEIPKTPGDMEVRPLAHATQRTRQHSVIVGWTRAVSDTAVNVSFYQRWSRSRLTTAADPLAAVARVNRELLTVGGKAGVIRFAGRHAMKAGVDGVWLRPEEDLAYDYTGYAAFAPSLGVTPLTIAGNQITFSGRDSGRQVSAYMQDSIRLGAHVTADLGVRMDRYDLVVSATHASPRVNVAVQLGGRTLVHASYNHFFVPPAMEGVLSSSAGLTERIQEIGAALPALEPTTEDQFEVGASTVHGPLRLTLTGYYRVTDNPMHTTVWPDSRIYSYASFDRARAYGLETKADLPGLARSGVTGYVNYAFGRVDFYNPVTGGFVTDAEHLTATSHFLAPMDQTHTLTGGLTYRHTASGLWLGTTAEYGSGTPAGHGTDADQGDADHEHAPRVPDHVTANLSVGVDLFRNGQSRSRLSFQVDVENITDRVYVVAQEGEFSPAQFSVPRLISATARIRF